MDEGTTFHIQIPVVTSGEGLSEPLVELSGHTPTRHILIVDDEPNIREILQRSLEFERYTVDLAEDGQEAWRKLGVMKYDCVVLDLKMPVMGGQELFQRIAEVDPDLTGKVLFITGDTANPENNDFLSSKSNPVLIKPFEPKEFRHQLKTLLDPD